jgi:transposase
MDIISAYQQAGSYRAAAAMCGTTHKTVRRVIEAHRASSRGEACAARVARARNYENVADLVAATVNATAGRVSAKRLLPVARAAGYEGSDRNFRRLVAEAKQAWRQGQARANGRRPAIWTPGEVLAIDWGTEVIAGRRVHVFCAVLAWSRFRFVRFARDEQQATTLALLAECFEVLGGVPKVVLADRMAALKGGVVANVVVPAPDYVRFATHYRFRPDFCEAADPQSTGIVENLVGYAKTDLLAPLELDDDPWAGGYAGSTSVPCPGARRSTTGATARSMPSRAPGCMVRAARVVARSSCWAPCRHCGWPRGRPRSAGRSTDCPASGSGRPATRCRTGSSARS